MEKYTIVVQNHQEQAYECSSEQDLLSGAIRAQIPFIVACRSGGCGICKVKIMEGEFERGICSKKTLPDDEREKNYSLACKTYPKSDMVISIVKKRENSRLAAGAGSSS